MLDMALFRKPTFTGGLIAAFALNASIYAVFTQVRAEVGRPGLCPGTASLGELRTL
jgi:hypothetical protein